MSDKRLSIKERIALLSQKENIEKESCTPSPSNSPRTVGKLNIESFSLSQMKENSPSNSSQPVSIPSETADSSDGSRRMSIKERIAAMQGKKTSASNLNFGADSKDSVEIESKREETLSVTDRSAALGMTTRSKSFKLPDGSELTPSKCNDITELNTNPTTDSSSIASKEEAQSELDVKDGIKEENDKHGTPIMSVRKRLAMLKEKDKKEEPPAPKKPNLVSERIAAIQPKPEPVKVETELRKPASSIAERMAVFNANAAAEKERAEKALNKQKGRASMPSNGKLSTTSKLTTGDVGEKKTTAPPARGGGGGGAGAASQQKRQSMPADYYGSDKILSIKDRIAMMKTPKLAEVSETIDAGAASSIDVCSNANPEVSTTESAAAEIPKDSINSIEESSVSIVPANEEDGDAKAITSRIEGDEVKEENEDDNAAVRVNVVDNDKNNSLSHSLAPLSESGKERVIRKVSVRRMDSDDD